MSLDVYLLTEKETAQCRCSDCGNVHTAERDKTLYDANITHNLAPMADKAGIYYALWRPEEKDWKKAKDIIPVLEKGLKKLKSKPKYFAKFNSPNGWGVYEHLVPFVEDYLTACKEYPDALIYASR